MYPPAASTEPVQLGPATDQEKDVAEVLLDTVTVPMLLPGFTKQVLASVTENVGWASDAPAASSTIAKVSKFLIMIFFFLVYTVHPYTIVSE